MRWAWKRQIKDAVFLRCPLLFIETGGGWACISSQAHIEGGGGWECVFGGGGRGWDGWVRVTVSGCCLQVSSVS